MAKKRKWIQKAGIEKGALHRKLGVSGGEKIPEAKLEKAEHSSNPETRKQAALAETLKGFHHKKKPMHKKMYGKH
jgi:hypothetical protein